MPKAGHAEIENSAARSSFPAVHRKKVTAAFDGGRLTSDGAVLLLAQAEREMVICAQMAACIADRRDPCRVIHRLDNILRTSILAICCGQEDADDLDMLRASPSTLRDEIGATAALGPLDKTPAQRRAVCDMLC
mgnify:CR=1 FL=1